MADRRILCYGDSNTWGFIPNTAYCRYEKSERYPGILQELLGHNYEVIEEGLNSRTLISEDTRLNREGRNGFAYLIPCLDSHDPIDMVVLMLGTNELREMFRKSAEEIGDMLEGYFVKTILNRKSQFKDTIPQLLIIAPPSIDESAEYAKVKYTGGSEKSKLLAETYKDIAQRNSCYFIDGTDLRVGDDGVHMTRESHKELASRVYKVIREIF